MLWHNLVLTGVIATVGCSRSARPIEFIIPNGLHGRVMVLHDKTAPDMPVVAGRYQAIIPVDGVLRIGSMRPFDQWHKESARFDDGKVLSIAFDGGSQAPDTIAMWAGPRRATWPDKRDYIVWVVGTEQEFRKFESQLAPPMSN
jgi:hypothetical protein